MQHATLWRVFLVAVTMLEVTANVTGRNMPLNHPTTTTTPTTTTLYGAAEDAPRFIHTNRMRQTFIAWPARRSVRLKCEAHGSVPLKYQWLKDGLPSIRRRLQPGLRTNMWYLRLKDLVTLDSGEYTCMVSNAYGSINHTYTLRVVEKSRTKPILKCGSPKNTSVFLGQNASMTCIVRLSGTLPDFRWLKWDGIPSSYPSSLDLANGSYTLVDPLQYETVPVEGKYGVKMTIANISAEDLGLYTCYVSNHLGSDYHSAFLTARTDRREVSSELPTSTWLDGHDISTLQSRAIIGEGDNRSPKPVTSRQARIPLSVFIGVLATWAVITTLALLWCHLYHRKMSATKPGIESL